ncbi:MAG TPA: hypothetical protein PKD26_16385 [Pyrinomonadaceae bacterium]|nr:hypothetical protein [Pyrinomonadaceae bacterium]
MNANGVRFVSIRHDLDTFKEMLTALEAKVAQRGQTLTKAQLIAPS